MNRTKHDRVMNDVNDIFGYCQDHEEREHVLDMVMMNIADHDTMNLDILRAMFRRSMCSMLTAHAEAMED